MNNKATQRPSMWATFEPLFETHSVYRWGDRFTVFSPADKIGFMGVATFYASFDEESENNQVEALVSLYENPWESYIIPVKTHWQQTVYCCESDLPGFLKEKLARIRLGFLHNPTPEAWSSFYLRPPNPLPKGETSNNLWDWKL